jgi:hypothetical protein
MHKHRAKPNLRTTRCFNGSVVGRYGKQNPRAHGNVCHEDTCSCGATRATNVNGCDIERGPWLTQD